MTLRPDLLAWAEEQQRQRGMPSLSGFVDWALEQMRYISDEIGPDEMARLIRTADGGGQSLGRRVGSIVHDVLRRER
jgi:hypothetical protein